MADNEWGEEVRAVVVRSAPAPGADTGSEVTEDELTGYCQERLSSFKRPRSVVFVDELPHTATGKLYKSVLREKYKDYVLPTA